MLSRVSLPEKRNAARVPVSMKVTSGETLGFGYAHNISEKGLAVEAQALAPEERVPDVGTELHLRFKLPRSPLVISVQGKVVRIDQAIPPPRLALEFIFLHPDFRSEIARFVAQQNTPS